MVSTIPMNRRQIDIIDSKQDHDMSTIDDYLWNSRRKSDMSTMSTVYFVYDFEYWALYSYVNYCYSSGE